MFKLLALAVLSTALLIEAIPLPGGGYYRNRGYYKHYRPQAHVYHYSHSHGVKHGYSSGHSGWYKGNWKPVHHAAKMAPAAMEPAAPEPVTRTADVGDVVDVAVGAGAFTTLVKVVSDLGLVETLKGVEAVTIFAPSDEAFAKLPEGTLESLTPEQAKAIVARHVVAGATVMAADVATGDVETFGGETVGLVKTEEGGVQVVYNGQTVNVVTADVEASNGVIHVIDNVIVGAPAPVEEIAPRSAAIDVDLLEEVNEVPEVAKVGDVVDVAVGNGAFTTLVKIVSDLGLVETLKGVEAVTIFAPSDDAFAKLPEGTLESLTPEQAKAIVSRHVVAGATVMAADVATGPVETFGGETIDLIKTEDGGVQVSYNENAVNVVAADVKASNGVIHVIDAVIL